MRPIGLFALLLSACSAVNSDVAEAPLLTTAGRVLIIGMDGTRAEALDVADTPHLDGLRRDGVTDMYAITGDVSLSGPGWSSMLSGVWCDKHHVLDNDLTWLQSQFHLYPPIHHRVEAARPDLRTVSVSHWAAINDEIICADEGASDCGGTDSVINTASDAEVRDAAIAELQNRDPHLIFLQFDDIDHAGHGDPTTLDPGGFCPYGNGDQSEGEEGGVCTTLNFNPLYLQAIQTTDTYIGEILSALKGRPEYMRENWLVIVSPDHGGGGAVFNQHGFPVDQDRRTFFIANGAAATALPTESRIKIVDVAATALMHLGISIPDSWDLDGQAVGIVGAPEYQATSVPTCYDPAVFIPDSGGGR